MDATKYHILRRTRAERNIHSQEKMIINQSVKTPWHTQACTFQVIWLLLILPSLPKLRADGTLPQCKGTFHLPELASKTGHFADGVPQFEFWVACQFFEFLQNGGYISLIMQSRRIFRSRPWKWHTPGKKWPFRPFTNGKRPKWATRQDRLSTFES